MSQDFEHRGHSVGRRTANVEMDCDSRGRWAPAHGVTRSINVSTNERVCSRSLCKPDPISRWWSLLNVSGGPVTAHPALFARPGRTHPRTASAGFDRSLLRRRPVGALAQDRAPRSRCPLGVGAVGKECHTSRPPTLRTKKCWSSYWPWSRHYTIRTVRAHISFLRGPRELSPSWVSFVLERCESDRVPSRDKP
jgi:hypothetical protein